MKKELKWEPKVEHVKGDKYPWKAYAVKGKNKTKVAEFSEWIYHHSLISTTFKNSRLKNKAIKAFYETSGLSKEPYSGKIEAYMEAKSYCAMANIH